MFRVREVQCQYYSMILRSHDQIPRLKQGKKEKQKRFAGPS